MPFENEVGGDLTMESFLKLRNEMTAHTYQCFQPRKEQLMQQRIAAYLKEDWAQYAECIKLAANDFNVCT